MEEEFNWKLTQFERRYTCEQRWRVFEYANFAIALRITYTIAQEVIRCHTLCSIILRWRMLHVHSFLIISRITFMSHITVRIYLSLTFIILLEPLDTVTRILHIIEASQIHYFYGEREKEIIKFLKNICYNFNEE